MKHGRWLLAAAVLLIPVVVFAVVRAGPGEPPAAPSEEVPAGPGIVAAEPVSVDDLAMPAAAAELIAEGRSWRAARRLRASVSPDDEPPLVLAATAAEAGWGGWERVRTLLEGRPWLDDEAGGAGWYLLGRSLEDAGAWPAAADAYARFLAVWGADEAPAGEVVVTRLRHARALLRAGRVDAGAAEMALVRDAAPALNGWAALLVAEALVERGDTAAVRELAGEAAEASPLRAQRAHVLAHRAAEDAAGARGLALSYAGRAGTDAARAEFAHLAGEAAAALGDAAGAAAQFRTAMRTAPASAPAIRAARALVAAGPVTAADRLALAEVYARHGDRARAVAQYRAWLSAGAGTPAERDEVRLRLGRTLFAAGRYPEVEQALAPLADGAGASAAEALHLTGRSQFRRGQQRLAVATWLRAAERFPGAPTAGEGLFFAADFHHDANEVARAAELYRRVVEVAPGTARADLAAMRLGGILFLGGDHAAAARIYETYRARFPEGGAWLQASYWAGRALEALGDTAGARARYRELREREPISYYSLLASRRLGVEFWPRELPPTPREDRGAEARVRRWMEGVDVLRAAGLEADAEAEADRLVLEAGDAPQLLYPLGEALNARGLTVRGIRIGQRLQRLGEADNARLLRILYPYPYRRMMEAEAREAGLDPFLVAALTRQESMFKARIASPAGARGLMQVMPATGAGLAAGLGIGRWDPELLYNPEINVALGVRFLADQMRRYDGSLPLVFTAYNAGPGRAQQWRRYPEFGNELLFTERIPFAETRSYVKILTRNIAIYQALYPEG